MLGADPDLGPLVRKVPGRRVPRTVDGAEFAVRAVLGQQVSTAAARTAAAALVAGHGQPVDDAGGGLTHLFPSPGRWSAPCPRWPAAGAGPSPPWSRRWCRDGSTSDRDATARRPAGSSAPCPGSGRGRSRWWPCGRSATPTPSATGDLGVRRAAAWARPGDLAGRPPGPFRAVAAVAGLRRPVPVGHVRPPDQHLAPVRPPGPPDPPAPIHEGADPCLSPPHPPWSPRVDSPIGPLTLMARDGHLTHLVMDDQAHAVRSAAREPTRRRRLRRGRRPARRVLRRRTHHLRRADDPRGHRVPAPGVGRSCAPSPTARPSATASWPDGWATRRPPGPWGSANGRNPVAVIVPCHRVIAADGSLGGYGGGLDRKVVLLDLERGRTV